MDKETQRFVLGALHLPMDTLLWYILAASVEVGLRITSFEARVPHLRANLLPCLQLLEDKTVKTVAEGVNGVEELTSNCEE